MLQYFIQSSESQKTDKPETTLLPQLDGIDIALGMRNFMGHEQSFFHTLRAFPEYGERYIEDCEKNLAKNNLKECWRLAHSLKGSSSMIGASELNTLARQLEYSCNEPNDMEKIRARFRQIVNVSHKMTSSIRIKIMQDIS